MDDLSVRFSPDRQRYTITCGQTQTLTLTETGVIRLRHMLAFMLPGDDDDGHR